MEPGSKPRATITTHVLSVNEERPPLRFRVSVTRNVLIARYYDTIIATLKLEGITHEEQQMWKTRVATTIAKVNVSLDNPAQPDMGSSTLSLP